MSAAGERLARTLRRHVFDDRVLAAVAAVPRDRFVPEELQAEAWENVPLPIGRRFSAPRFFSRRFSGRQPGGGPDGNQGRKADPACRDRPDFPSPPGKE